MAINSVGYPGSVDSIQWAKLADELGQRYGVADYNDWRVSPVVGPDRTVAIAAGTGFGRGILDVNTAPVNIQLAAGTGAAGTLRFDLIVARRTWGATNATTFQAITGTSTPVVPAGRLSGPGDVDDQPIALVRITTGSTVPIIELDMRTWPSKISTATDTRALVDAVYGDQAIIGTTRYRRGFDSSNNPAWITDEQPWSSWSPTWSFAYTAGFVGNGILRGRYRLLGSNTCAIELELTFGSTTNGGVGEWAFGYPPNIRPSTTTAEHWIGAKVYVPRAGGQLPASAWLRQDRIYVYSGYSAGDSRQSTVRNATGPNPDLGTSIPHADNDFAWAVGANLMVNGVFETA